MRICLYILFLMLELSLYSQSKGANEGVSQMVFNKSTNDSILVYNKVKHAPEFSGGHIALLRFIAKNYNYPKIEKEKSLEGTTVTRILVSKEGKVYNPEVLKGIPNCKECGEEAIRVVSITKDWKPAKNEADETVNAYYTVPVRIVLR